MMQAIHHPVSPAAKALDDPTGTSGTSGSSGSSSDTGDDTSITANDFLTLLVAEMKNQDPTADTDPNAYIDQLVQVNSLQQLIQINQDLGGSSASSDASSEASSHAIGAASRLATSLAPRHTAGIQHAQVPASGHPGQLPATAQAVEAPFRERIHQS